MDLRDDLRARWVPSDWQKRKAAERLAAGASQAVTVQLLVGKHYGIWTEDVGVLHVLEVFADRDVASAAAETKAREVQRIMDAPVSASYCYHFSDGGFAVFEDILAAKAGKALGEDE